VWHDTALGKSLGNWESGDSFGARDLDTFVSISSSDCYPRLRHVDGLLFEMQNVLLPHGEAVQEHGTDILTGRRRQLN
jgi:hypothetical protein